jgi:hypothetical protein
VRSFLRSTGRSRFHRPHEAAFPLLWEACCTAMNLKRHGI